MKLSATLFLAGAATTGAFAPTAFFGRSNTAVNVAAGDSLPSVELFKGFPDLQKVNIAEYSKGKNLIIVGLPGAFTPTWSAVQVPGYIEAEDALKAAGVDEVVVYCVNDSAVMQAWSSDQKVGGTFISMMGDPAAEFTAALDMKMTHEGPPSVGIIGRCKRHAMYVMDGEVKFVAISEGEDDPAGDSDPSATLAGALLKAVQAEAGVTV